MCLPMGTGLPCLQAGRYCSCSLYCSLHFKGPQSNPHHHPLCPLLPPRARRAWDFGKPLLLAPAMNTFMWDSPFTAQHLAAITRLGATVRRCGGGIAGLPAGGWHVWFKWLMLHGWAIAIQQVTHPNPAPCTTLQVVPPVSKRLACGDKAPAAWQRQRTLLQHAARRWLLQNSS